MSIINNNLLLVQERIKTACQLASRDPGTVKLLAVSKTKPLEMIQEALAAGQNDFGENYLQDAMSKIPSIDGATWHYIGAIQSNKTRDIARYFDWVHTVASLKVARRLSSQRDGAAPPLNILLQVNINRESGKAGILAEELPGLVDSISDLPRIVLRGLMAIPEQSNEASVQRANFSTLCELQKSIQQQLNLPAFDQLSMGMSGDLEAAIAEGATWVRIGTSIFGKRLANAKETT
jgi:pyridoxal phosphate enzyme (YggS family)